MRAIFILISFLVSCEISTNKNFSYISETYDVIYNDKVYYLSEYSYGDFYWDDADVVHISTVIGYIAYGPFKHYGDDYKEPAFIVSVHGYKTRSNIWFPEKDFRYENQEFIIEDTGCKIRALECYDASFCINGIGNNYEKYKIATFKWYLSTIPALYDKISIYNIDDVYYVGGISDNLYKCTPEFIDILHSIGILDSKEQRV